MTKVGVYAHAPHADVLGLRYRLPGDTEAWREWRGYFADRKTPESAEAPPKALIEAVEAGMPILAHNAAYERVVLGLAKNTAWWPDPPIEQFRCAAAWAAAFNLPRGLGPLSRQLLPAGQAKLVEVAAGVQYMWNADRPLHSAEDMDLQMMYCGRDVDSMHDCMAALPPMDPDFLSQYHASEAINDRGVLIDRDLAAAIVSMKPRIDRDLLADLDRATGGGVKLRGPSLLKWLQANLPEDAQDLLVVDRKVRDGFGFKTRKKVSADKGARRQVLQGLEDMEGVEHIRDALAAFEEANKAATTKFAAAIRRVSDDGALRGQFVMAGAAQTGRFSSHGVQVHNLKRDVADNAIEIIETIKAHCDTPGVIAQRFDMSVNDAASQVLRPMFRAEKGRLLYWGDWSSVEARMLPWLSGDDRADPLLNLFRRGGDVYLHEARNIYAYEVTGDMPERQIGKVATLALGFQGGVGAFQAMATGYGVKITDAEANRIKHAWRAANVWAVMFWERLERAAMQAVSDPVTLHPAGRVAYQFLPGLVGGTLLCWLPSGRWVAYPKARIRLLDKFEADDPQPALTFMHPTYGPSATYGGSLAENITQGECATLLREALVRCEAEGLETVLHVHDEIVGEADERRVAHDARILADIMNTPPAWAPGLPLDAEVEIGPRYKIKRLAQRAA